MIRILGPFLFLLLSFHAQAQPGIISGTVTAPDDGQQQPMPFVSVALKGGGGGGTTDLDGRFRFPAAAGDHALVVSFMGFEPVERPVHLEPGQTVEVRIELPTQSIEMKAVDVVATRRRDTERAVIMETRNSMQVVNAVSSEMIARSQDSDGSEVMRRVPGVTVIGNGYIMIRGLSERYSRVMLHDVFAPSMEPDVRSFDFDIIPSSLIDRLVIYKSPAAELPGEFAGGVVKLYTKGIPNRGSFSASISTGYRQGSSLRDFKRGKRGFLHHLGLNDGYNDLPAGFPADVRLVNSDVDMGNLNEVGRSLNNNWVPEQTGSGLDRSVSVTNASRFLLRGKEAGNITSVTYQDKRAIFDVERADYNAYDAINQRSAPIYEFNDRQYNQHIRTGILSNFAVRLNARHSIELKNLLTVFNSSQYVNRTGRDIDFQYLPDNHSFDQVYRGIYSGQLTGKHQYHEDRTTLAWTAGYGASYRDQPDYRRYRSDVDENTGERTLFVGVPLSPNYLGRFYSEMRERTQAATVALEHQLAPERKFAPKLRAGLFMDRNQREFSARNIGFVRANFLLFDEGLLHTTIDSLFHPANINQHTGIRIGEQSNPSDSYSASNLLLAGYLGADLPLIKDKLMLNTGLRLEHNRQQLESALLTGEPVLVDNIGLSLLPSANFAYRINAKQQLRLSYGRTLNRPEFREIAPFSFYDFNYNLVKKGSDSLRTPSIDHLDLRWELYPSPTEMISVALFHKRFKDPIETLFVPGGGSGGIKTFTFGNARHARSMGVEVEARRSLAGLTASPVLDRFSAVFNASLIDSHVNLGREALGQSNERPLQGQSPYIVNAGLYYNDTTRGLQFSALYNVIGPRIFIIGFDAYPDIYEMPRGLLEVTATVRLSPSFDLRLGVGDVLNRPHVLLQDANQDGQLRLANDQVIQHYRSGRTFMLGLSFHFERARKEG